jgi:hypothetical protein
MSMEANAPAGEVLPVTMFQLNQKKPADTLKREARGDFARIGRVNYGPITILEQTDPSNNHQKEEHP